VIQEMAYNLAWTLFGFVLGCLVGYERVVPKRFRQEESMSETEYVPQQTPRQGRWIGAVVILLALFSVAQGSYFAFENSRTAECQARFNDDFARVTTQRAVWADEDRRSLTKMLNEILAAKEGTSAGRDSVNLYLATINRNEKLRQENPLPNLEDRRC